MPSNLLPLLDITELTSSWMWSAQWSRDKIASYSVIHNSIAPSKGLCSKMALGEVGLSLP